LDPMIHKGWESRFREPLNPGSYGECFITPQMPDSLVP